MNMYVYNKDMYVLTFTNKIILYKMTFIFSAKEYPKKLSFVSKALQVIGILIGNFNN